MGSNFSAKDFRTWAGTLVCACALARDGNEIPVQKTAKNKRIVAAIKETSEVLGNTPAVCRGSYVCPEIISAFEKGQVIDNCASSLEDLIAFRGSWPAQSRTGIAQIPQARGEPRMYTDLDYGFGTDLAELLQKFEIVSRYHPGGCEWKDHLEEY